uniref:Uncharacterized protein n=1 Tax=Sphaeramia orbicularis TaxID=375764 RepID=A0A672YQH6_9TELE
MAEGFSELRLCCSICLDVLKNPVTLQCGHSYCMDCINGYWDQEGQKGVYCCPQCRFRFRTRPTLSKSTVLADLVGTFSVVQEEDGVRSQDVECDFCTEKKLKALVEVSASIQEKICSRHDKLLEVYCRTDDQCICLLCVMDEHKGHDTVSAAAERKEKQGPLTPIIVIFLDSCHLSLDPNTAFENLMLSEGNSKVTWVKKPRGYPYHPDRFTKYDQVLCAESLFGVCYWEVHWKGPRVEVAVCYKGAEMEECGFGYTDKSWCFSLSTSGCTFWHNGAKTKISVPCSSTVGVYLNHQGGNLSFYSVSDSGQMTLLHKVQTTFSEPLTPGFMVSRGLNLHCKVSDTYQI